MIFHSVCRGVNKDECFVHVLTERKITVVYHRIAIRCGNFETGVEIVKKRDFGEGFIVVRFSDKID